MIIFPAIDLFDGNIVRLFKGDYNCKTVYGNDPSLVAKTFAEKGATHIHIVDLEAAKDGTVHNIDSIIKIKETTGLFCEVGGGIRSIEVLDRYFSVGIDRAIIGTAAVKNPEFLKEAVEKYGDKIAVGADFKDGYMAINGWLEKTEYKDVEFCKMMENYGVKTFICTDISKDGTNKGTNLELYKTLSENVNANIIASGGVSSLADIQALRKMNVYGAILGKAYYDGLVDLSEAIEVAK